MTKLLTDLRPVYVVGIGWHQYGKPSTTPYVELGLKAIRDALADANIEWGSVESSFVGTSMLGMASGVPMLRYLGANENPVVHIQNASATSSAAFRQACIEVASGISDVALTVGVDKPSHSLQFAEQQTGVVQLAEDEILPHTRFALLADRYAQQHGISHEDIARAALKNHNNGYNNPNAQRRKQRTMDDILGGGFIAGSLTRLQCCPISEGAAAAIVVSEEAIKRLGIDAHRAIRVSASAAMVQTVYKPGTNCDAELTQRSINKALAEAKIKVTDLDVLELHDAFSIEELFYIESIGLCPEGQAAARLKDGEYHIGSNLAVNPSGGLVAMGHPIGPTGVGQICEITQQLRRESGVRQQPEAKVGLAHMVGLGAVGYAHILQRP